jgi:hypothetical protein
MGKKAAVHIYELKIKITLLAAYVYVCTQVCIMYYVHTQARINVRKHACTHVCVYMYMYACVCT